MENKTKGFVLVELIVVIVIIGILASIALPRFLGFRDASEESVCESNRKTAERLYRAYLHENDLLEEDSALLFTTFLNENFDEICPSGGEIQYEDGEVRCSKHPDAADKVEEPSEEVPWL